MLINDDDERLLLQALNDGEVVLALGAGASANCTKPNGAKVLLGSGLAESVAKKGGLTYAGEDLVDVIGGVVGSRISETQFHSLLKEEYTKLRPSRELNDILRYTWRRVYTWNIDDAINNIGKSVQSRRFYNGMIDKVAVHEGHDYLQIIHLHGEATKPEHGFIFSSSEYNKRLLKESHDWYRALSSDYVNFTPVFVGSRLKEPILSAELDRARPSSGLGLGLAFLVTPDDFTEVQLAALRAKSIVIIKTTLEGFVSWINEKQGRTLTPADVAKKRNSFVQQLLNLAGGSPRDVESAESVIPRSWKESKASADIVQSSQLQRIARSFLEGAPPT